MSGVWIFFLGMVTGFSLLSLAAYLGIRSVEAEAKRHEEYRKLCDTIRHERYPS